MRQQITGKTYLVLPWQPTHQSMCVQKYPQMPSHYLKKVNEKPLFIVLLNQPTNQKLRVWAPFKIKLLNLYVVENPVLVLKLRVQKEIKLHFFLSYASLIYSNLKYWFVSFRFQAGEIVFGEFSTIDLIPKTACTFAKTQFLQFNLKTHHLIICVFIVNISSTIVKIVFQILQQNSV